MVADGHWIIAEDALNLVELLSLSTPTHEHTLVTYTSTDNRTTSTVVDRIGTTIELNQWVDEGTHQLPNLHRMLLFGE